MTTATEGQVINDQPDRTLLRLQWRRVWPIRCVFWPSHHLGLPLNPSHQVKTCGRGGIGRRAALRSLWGNTRGSSSLLDRTNYIPLKSLKAPIFKGLWIASVPYIVPYSVWHVWFFMAQNRTLPHVEGTEVRHGRYHLKMHIPYAIREFYGNKAHVRRSLRTADPRQAAQAVTLQRAEFHQREQEKERLANLPKLVDALRPDQRRLFDDAGGLEGLLDAFQRSHTALAFARVGQVDPAHVVAGPDYEPPEPVEPLTARLEEAQDRAAYEVLRADAVAEGKTLKALGQKVKVPGEVFGLGELSDVYAKERKQPSKTKGNFATIIRRFIEFHGDIALEDLTLAHLRDYGGAVLSLPKNTSSAKLRGLSMPELIRIADAEGLERVGTTTRDKDLSILKALTSFGRGQGYMPTDPWKGYSAVAAKGKYAHRRKPRHPFKPGQVRVVLNYAAANRDARTVDSGHPCLAHIRAHVSKRFVRCGVMTFTKWAKRG